MDEALADLADRWRRARVSALRAFAPPDTAHDDLLQTASERAPVEVMRRAFDNSLRLGRGFARTYGDALTLEELREALSALGHPCLHGAVREPAVSEKLSGAFYLERTGCTQGTLGPAACDFMREAIAGLVLGITDGAVRHARHESRGHHGRRCVDLFYVEPESPLRFGPIPSELRDTLTSISRLARAFDSGSEVIFLGLAEGVLTYRIDKHSGPGDFNVRALVERAVQRKLPELSLLEVSPRPVIAGDP